MNNHIPKKWLYILSIVLALGVYDLFIGETKTREALIVENTGPSRSGFSFVIESTDLKERGTVLINTSFSKMSAEALGESKTGDHIAIKESAIFGRTLSVLVNGVYVNNKYSQYNIAFYVVILISFIGVVGTMLRIVTLAIGTKK